MKMQPLHALVGLTIVLIVAGCGRYAGGIVGSHAIPGSKLQNCFAFQFDTYEEPYSESKRRPLFAVVWQAHSVGGSSQNGRNMLTSIHGHPVAPSWTEKAVYALQPDYSLKKLPLTEKEIDRLFSIIRSDEETGPTLASDAVWQQKVKPSLRTVEPPHE